MTPTIPICAYDVAMAMKDGEFAMQVLGILSTSTTPSNLLIEGDLQARCYQASLPGFLRGLADEIERRFG